MQDTSTQLVDQWITELVSAPEGTSLKPFFQQLDGAADKVVCANDEDYACAKLQQAAARVTSASRRVELLRHALYRAQVYAGFATSGGEGLARMRSVEQIRRQLDGATHVR